MTGWSKERPVVGPAPIGEVETRCAGCRARFVAGETYVTRKDGGLFARTVFAHPGACTERVEAAA